MKNYYIFKAEHVNMFISAFNLQIDPVVSSDYSKDKLEECIQSLKEKKINNKEE